MMTQRMFVKENGIVYTIIPKFQSEYFWQKFFTPALSTLFQLVVHLTFKGGIYYTYFHFSSSPSPPPNPAYLSNVYILRLGEGMLSLF